MTPAMKIESPPGNVIDTVKRVLWGHVGQDNRISREDLASEVGARLACEMDDRPIRKSIEELRQNDPEGALIISSSRADGYWIASSSTELEAANMEDISRIEAAQKKITNRRKAIERQFTPQPTLPMDLPHVRARYE